MKENFINATNSFNDNVAVKGHSERGTVNELCDFK